MDFKPAVRQHIEWRFRLYNMVSGKTQENLNVEQVSVDNRCILGQWIYSEGMEQYSEDKYFQNLVKDHQRFHDTLGNIVGRFQNNEAIDIKQELGIGGLFDKASIEVVRDVLLLQKNIEKAKQNADN